MKKVFYTVSDICKMLKIAKNTLYNWESAGKIPKAKRDPMNNYRIYTTEDVKKLRRIAKR